MTSTSPGLDHAASMTGPSTVLDLPVALAAMRGLTTRIVPDRGGAVIDADHPLGAALIPHALSLGAWVLTTEPTLVGDLRRLTRPAVTVILDHADRDPGLSGADIAIVDEVGAAPTTTPLLLRLTADRLRRPRGRATGLLGFSIDLPRGGDRDGDDGIDALRAGWTWWRTERDTARPVCCCGRAAPGRRPERPTLCTGGRPVWAPRHRSSGWTSPGCAPPSPRPPWSPCCTAPSIPG